MLAYTMIAVLAVLAFLCISHAIPTLAAAKPCQKSLPNSRRSAR
jgi:hypothetical protein